jgi:ABC-type lipoprotein export system ATPase subunit/ABC-type antimicrobial peptide transport system permease subunit
MIKVNGLNKFYNKGKSNELHVINDTSLTLEDTGLVCILGESGSGKTTLMNTISGLDDFVSGSIDVDGVEVRKYGDPNQELVRNEKFGYIFQNYYLLQDRTVEYNILLSLSLYDLTDAEKEERVDYVLKAVDMWRYKKRLVSQLSGGQQQRIAIARALAKSPRVIFADEPTGNLDEANTMRIMGILKKVSKKCLVVVVTHEKTIADFFADRILWIADGKIEKEQYKTSQTTYQYIEDTNIYLQEYDKSELNNEDVKVEIYSGKEKPPVDIKLICEHGKIYISVGDSKNVELLTMDSEKQVIDSKKPIIEMTDVEELEYNLEPLESVKKPKLGFNKIREIGRSNIKSMGKKQVFLIVSLFVMAVMMVFAVQDIMTIINIDTQSVVKTDSHYLHVSIEKASLTSSQEFADDKLKIYKGLFEEVKNKNDVTIVSTGGFSYLYEGFSQLESIKSMITNFSFVPIEKISKDDLYYGEMPSNNKEIVIDRWVLENFIKNSPEISNIIHDVKHFVGKTMEYNGTSFKVSGISDKEEMSIYIKGDELLRIAPWSEKYLTLSEFKKLYPEYKDVELKINEDGKMEVLGTATEYMQKYIINTRSEYSLYYDYEKVAENNDYGKGGWFYDDFDKEQYEKELAERKDELLKEINDKYGKTVDEIKEIISDPTGFSYDSKTSTNTEYSVIGSFPQTITDEIGIEMVIPDEAISMIKEDMLNYREEFYIYTDDKYETTKMLSNLAFNTGADVTLEVKDAYTDDLNLYKEAKTEEFNGRIIVTVTIFVISMIILYFMMKANAIGRMQDLGVYRLIGISKYSIIGLFAYENFVITSYTSVVGAILATVITNILASIPSINAEINYPWYAFLGTIIFLYLVNILVGIMPIRKILKLPPAQLASKYDI